MILCICFFDSGRQLAALCQYAALTSGAEGLYFIHDEQVIHAECRVDEVYSAVGSGDCVMGGLAVAFKRKSGVTEAAILAVACGTANCIREDLGMLYLQDVERLVSQVKVTVR